MKTIMMTLVALCVFVPSVATAQADTASTVVATCEDRYRDKFVQQFCIQEANLKLLERRLLAGEAGLKAEVERLKRQIADARVAQTSKPPAPASSPVPAPTLPAPVPVPQRPAVGYVGVPHQVVPALGQYAAATFDPGGPRLDLHSLELGSQTYVRGATQVRVVVKKNGVPIPVANADPAQPWGAFYADLDGDGRPDRAPYRGVDPLLYDDVFIGLVGPRDRIELIWLVDSGKRVLVPGLPPEILWARSQRVEYKAPDVIGRWRQAAYGGWRL